MVLTVTTITALCAEEVHEYKITQPIYITAMTACSNLGCVPEQGWDDASNSLI